MNREFSNLVAGLPVSQSCSVTVQVCYIELLLSGTDTYSHGGWLKHICFLSFSYLITTSNCTWLSLKYRTVIAFYIQQNNS